jgi:histidine phosphotransferase ChpT
MQNEAMQLIVNSAHEAVNRLQFYRQAYGRVGEAGEACIADKKKITEDFFSATKVKLDWPDSHTDAAGVPLSQKMSRLLLNLIIIAGSSLIKGGTLSVRLERNDRGEKILQLTAIGDVVKADADIAAILSGSEDVALTPKSAQPYLAMKLAEEVGATISLENSAVEMTIVALQRQAVLASVS